MAEKKLTLADIETAFCIATAPMCSFWQIGSEVYRVPTPAAGESLRFDSWGHPLGKRWECSRAHFDRFRDSVFSFAKDTPEVIETKQKRR